MNKKELKRGEIYKILFPYTFDPKFKTGKVKFVLILQGGEYFNKFSTTVVLLLTSNGDGKDLDHVVEIEKGTTHLWKTSYVECSQPYTVLKRIFDHPKVAYMGKLSKEKMSVVDEALYIGLGMGVI